MGRYRSGVINLDEKKTANKNETDAKKDPKPQAETGDVGTKKNDTEGTKKGDKKGHGGKSDHLNLCEDPTNMDCTDESQLNPKKRKGLESYLTESSNEGEEQY